MTNQFKKEISSSIRKIRKKNGLTQSEMADIIGLSQSRLSEIEKGMGSITAEQFINLIQKFNLSMVDLVPSLKIDSNQELTNSLIRLGSTTLKSENPGLFSSWLYDTNEVIKEILISNPSKENILEVSITIIRHSAVINLDTIAMKLYDLGIDGRLWWLVEGSLWALRKRLKWDLTDKVKAHYLMAEGLLSRRSRMANVYFSIRKAYPIDVIDKDIISPEEFENAKADRDELAVRWRVVTKITQNDFTLALKEAEEKNGF